MRVTSRRVAALMVAGGIACAGLVFDHANAAMPNDPCDSGSYNSCREVILTNQTADIKGVQIIGLMAQGPESPDQVLSACLPVAPNTTASGQYSSLAAYLALQAYSTSDCSDAGRRLGGDTGTVPPGNIVTVPESGPAHVTFNDTTIS